MKKMQGDMFSVVQLMNGKKLSETMQLQMKETVDRLKDQGITPGLVVILVGEDPASQIYVRNKERAAKKVGIYSLVDREPADITEEALLALIDRYNQDDKIDGILVQLPLPKHIDPQKVTEKIDPAKDVDGFHPYNLGRLLIGDATRIPCTPFGIMKMLEHYGISPAGKRAVVVGRSNIVGKPMAQLLLQADATVTMAHSKTQELKEITRQADILVAAIGKANYITGEYIKPGAVVIDVGMNRKADGKLAGDVLFSEASEIAGWITPVPGGVGPMTITMLLYQTIAGAKAKRG